MQEKGLYTSLTFKSLSSPPKEKSKMKYIQNKVDEIRKALEYGLYECALTLTMTLPDICAKIAFKNDKRFYEKGKWLVGESYKQWFKDYVFKYFENNNFPISEENKKHGFTGTYLKFLPDYCYDLRCFLLHEGNIEQMAFKEENGIILLFGLTEMSECNIESLYPNGKVAVKGLEINIQQLCYAIINGVEEFYNNIDSKEFEKYELKINRRNNPFSLLSRVKCSKLKI